MSVELVSVCVCACVRAYLLCVAPHLEAERRPCVRAPATYIYYGPRTSYYGPVYLLWARTFLYRAGRLDFCRVFSIESSVHCYVVCIAHG